MLPSSAAQARGPDKSCDWRRVPVRSGRGDDFKDKGTDRSSDLLAWAPLAVLHRWIVFAFDFEAAACRSSPSLLGAPLSGAGASFAAERLTAASARTERASGRRR